jgi:L-iditol 2-dehydrogenase
MKAAFLTGIQQFEVHEIPAPRPPADGLVLQVQACGVCGSDLRRWKEGIPPGSAPLTPGHEIAGQVIQVGSRVAHIQVGDRLAIAPDVHCGRCYYCKRGLYNLCDDLHLVGITPGYPGGFSEQMILTGEILSNGIVHAIPAGLSYEYAALAEPCSSVLAAHEKIGAGLEDTIVVMGGGPIGCLHMAIAHARGARVILSEPSLIRRQMAEPFQPDLVLDPSMEDVVKRVREATAGRGADAVICANPIAATQTQAVELVRKGGKVILFGGLPKANPLTHLDGNRIHYGEIDVLGSFSYHPSFHEMALEILQRGLLPADQLITHVFPLEKIGQAFQTAASGEALKVMLQLSPRLAD